MGGGSSTNRTHADSSQQENESTQSSPPQAIIRLESQQHPLSIQQRWSHSRNFANNAIQTISTVVIKNFCTLKKRTLKLVESDIPSVYYLSFKYDSVSEVDVSVHFLCTGKISANCGRLQFLSTEYDSTRRRMPAGIDIIFNSKDDGLLDFNKTPPERFMDRSTPDFYPIAIVLQPVSNDNINRCEFTVAALVSHKVEASASLAANSTFPEERAASSVCGSQPSPCWDIVAVKTILTQDNRCFDIQEIYGIATSDLDPAVSDYDVSDYRENRDCVICLSEKRTTLLLPCRHLCICSSCAVFMRAGVAKCPICRREVNSLLQISKAAN